MLVAVADLEPAARGFCERHGLQALPGGRHPGVGTANLIVPLGSSYLELIAVVDQREAEQHRHWLVTAVAEGATFAGWAVRTPDLDATRRALLAAGWRLPAPADGARRQPDGSLLTWRTQNLEEPGQGGLPFVIEWAPGSAHPGSAPARHPSGARGIRRIVVGEQRERLRSALEADVDYEVRSSRRGVIEVVLETAAGELVIG